MSVYLETRKDGTKAWFYDFSYKGMRFRKLAGATKSDAIRAQEKARSQVLNDEYQLTNQKKDPRFELFADTYLRNRRNMRSYTRDELSIKHLKAFFKGRTLGSITGNDVRQYINSRLEERSANASINRELACLKHLYTCAFDWEEAKSIQRPKIKLLQEPPGRTRYLSEEEAASLLLHSPEYLQPIILTALYTGMRKSEITSLTWRQIHIDDAINPFIELIKTKNNKSRFVPVNDDMVHLLATLKKGDDDFVFHGKQGLPIRYFKEPWQKALKDAGINDFKFHDLRHSFASHFLMKGGDLLSLKEILGHSSLKMVERYTHLASAHKQRQVNRLNGTFRICQPNASEEYGGSGLSKKAN